jgi:oxygen-dependent protoporphyrinogen oxidase
MAAARTLAQADVRVRLVEASDRLGGKIETSPVAGVPIDAGPDAFIVRRPEALQLARELGLGDQLVSPAAGSALLLVDGSLRPLPGGLVLGVPTDLDALAASGLLSADGVTRAAADLDGAGPPLDDGDSSVWDLIAGRVGDEVAGRLVDPLLGSINASHTSRLSAEVAAPQLLAAARQHPSLIEGLRAQQRAAAAVSGPAGPVFHTVRGGLSAFVDALAEDLRARDVEMVLEEAAEGIDGPTVLATPAWVSASLLADSSPAAAAFLQSVDYASVALVTFAYPASAVPEHWAGSSGFLVPRGGDGLLTAGSFGTSKWPHWAPDGMTVLRASTGRLDDERFQQLDDDALAATLHAELAAAMGLRAEPVEVRVRRWLRSFPQHEPGHLARLGAAEAALSRDLPFVALAGSALRGVGIPACIATGQAAARRVLASFSST